MVSAMRHPAALALAGAGNRLQLAKRGQRLADIAERLCREIRVGVGGEERAIYRAPGERFEYRLYLRGIFLGGGGRLGRKKQDGRDLRGERADKIDAVLIGEDDDSGIARRVDGVRGQKTGDLAGVGYGGDAIEFAETEAESVVRFVAIVQTHLAGKFVPGAAQENFVMEESNVPKTHVVGSHAELAGAVIRPVSLAGISFQDRKSVV